VSWRWVFWVNLPLGLLAALTVARRFREQVHRAEHRIDVVGATLLVTGCTLLVLGLLEGGVAWSWTGPVGIGVLGGGVLLLVAFVLVERRAAEPVLPLWVLSRRVLVAGTVSQVGVGVMIVGLSTFVPTYVQNVLGTDAVVAGLAIGALSLGWPIAASQCGRVYLRIGFRDTALLGSVLVVAACVPAVRWDAATSPWEVGVVCFVIGLGMGFASAPVVVAVQSVVGWEHRGVVTSTNMFGRTVGSALGAAVLGAVANAALLGALRDPPDGVVGLPAGLDAATALLAAPGADPVLVDAVRQALADALHQVFVGLVVVAALMGLGVAVMPRRTRTLDGEEVISRDGVREGRPAAGEG
jgi:MFS family permease